MSYSIIISYINEAQNHPKLLLDLNTAFFEMSNLWNGAIQGIFPYGILLQANYFGARESSSTAYSSNAPNSSEYMSNAITVITPNTNGWTPPNLGQQPIYIVNNKIDRAFRGIWIEGTEDIETEIAGNNIYLEEDFTFGAPAFGYGVGAKDKTDSLADTGNTVVGNISSSLNSKISSVYCENIGGMFSPSVTCNFVDMSHYGFEFNNWNGSAIWQRNTMCNNFAGLALTNNGVIGQQGTPGVGMGNVWSMFCSFQWPGPYGINHTYVENSNPALSLLYCSSGSQYVPSQNGTNGFFPSYTFNSTYFNNSTTQFDCMWTNYYNPAPTWRSQNTGERDTISSQLNEAKLILVYPNPAHDLLFVELPDVTQQAEFNIYNALGKLIQTKRLQNQTTIISLHSIKPGIYLVEVKQGELLKRFKIIINN